MEQNLSAFEQFCGGVFWNSSLTWNTEPGQAPGLTSCFQNTVLVWAPCAFLLLLLPLYSYNLAAFSSIFPTPVSKLYITKLVIGICMVAAVVCDVIKYGVECQQQCPSLVLLVSPLILCTTLLISVILMEVERRKGFITSGMQFIFYLLLLLAGTLQFASLAIKLQQSDDEDLFRTVTFFTRYGLNLLMFFLLCFADSHPDLEVNQRACPETKASFLSRLSFWWLTRLMLRGYSKELTEEDLFQLHPRDHTDNAAPQFFQAWDKELRSCQWNLHRHNSNDAPGGNIAYQRRSVQGSHEDDETSPLLDSSGTTVAVVSGGKQKTPSLFMVLTRTYGWKLLIANLCKLVSDILTFVGPIVQSLLINFTDDKAAPQWHGYLFAVTFFCTAMLQSICMQQLFHIGMCLGMRIRGALMAAVYKKALTISNESRKDTTVGEIVNLMAVDTERIEEVVPYLWLIWSCPFQIAVAVYMLYQLLGIAVLAGVGVLIVLFPINGFLASIQQKLEVKQMALKDNRIKLLNEVFNGIKVLKFYAWELSFKQKVDAVRNMELANLKMYWYLGAINGLSWMVAPFLVMLTTLLTFVLTGHVLDANTAFVSLTLFNILQFPINLLPMMVSFLVTAVVSLRRLGKFLRQHDIEPDNVIRDQTAENPVEIKDGTFAWGTGEADLRTLESINLTIEEGSLVAVVGLVGSGKSSLISAILGEMERLSGTVTVRGRTAYVAQQAWIQNASLRDNVLFGKTYVEEQYEAVIDTCALKADMETLTAGDKTEIGEKGINLSGGQKQRVSLARAVYQDVDLYLFDDPLSAVDAHVGKHIFSHVIGKDGILKDKTRILVTHGIHWLPMVDQIIVMDHGCISEVGSYEQLMQHNGAFAQFLKTYLLEDKGEADNEEAEDDLDPEVAEIQRAILERVESVCSEDADPNLLGTSPGSPSKRTRTVSRSLSKPAKDEEVKDLKKEENRQASEKLIEEEQSQSGNVKLAVFMAYMKALGLFNSIFIFGFYALYQGASIFANVWLTQWTTDPILSNSTIPANSTDYINQRDMYLGVYGAAGGMQALFILFHSFILAYAVVKASAEFHSDMLSAILHSPMAFFDTTPIGRILNRFSRDIETIDNLLPSVITMAMGSALVVLSSFIVISYSTPIFLSVILPLAIIYYLIQRFYIPTSRQLKRLESTTRSPIYAHFSESISGAATIRAFRKQFEFQEKSNDLINHNLVFYFANISSNRWLNIGLDFLGACVVLAAAIFAVVERNAEAGVTGSIVGLSISYALQATQELNWFIRTISDFETNVVSVERINEYIKLAPEGEWEIEATKPAAEWPQHGAIKFDEYSTRYRPGLDLVIRDINLVIRPQEKIGICGRTGAGKSSLTTALFRIIEAASGSITIDDVTISTIGLHNLRSRITILPQDPVLFSGSLRLNLDPIAAYNDSELWWSLEKAHLKAFVEGLPAGLEYDCGEGGQNLSVGQRQLVCLARALLRKTKILVLDEATAAVDMETDNLIQNTIQTEFKDCTILTIAHRLNTIMDSDRILVLENGKISEFDTPKSLLENKTSILYSMAKESGLVG